MSHLRLVPCDHYWLEVRTSGGQVTAICKHFHCRKTQKFSMDEWQLLAEEGRALNKPVRV